MNQSALDVREQVRLPFRRLLEVCLDSMSYRLLRSFVTAIIIVLAIAFLASIMMEGYFGRAIYRRIITQARELTACSRFLSRATQVPAAQQLAVGIPALRKGSADFRNLQRWGGFTDAQVDQFLQDSQQVNHYLEFFDNIPVGRRVLLVGLNTGLEIFDWLGRPENQQQFARRLEPMKSLKVPGGYPAFEQFVQRWSGYSNQLAGVRQQYRQTVERVRQYAGDRPLADALRQAAAANRTADFFAALDERGLAVDPAEVPHILNGLDFEERQDWALGQLKKQPVRTGWYREFNVNFSPNDALVACAKSDAPVQWVQRVLAAANDKEGLDPGKLRRTAAEYVRRTDLLESEQELTQRYGATQGLGERTVWLVFVSFLVCMVGIANAMLMSVLERFKEIATMKCLGARNETIGFLFVTESIMLGLLGGIVGLVLGFVIVMARQLWSHGALVFTSFPTADILRCGGYCLGCSLLLATLAAVYPSWVAARMAPMEAMRVD